KCILLSDVNLQHNNLTALPESIGELRNLTRLGLKYNQLTSIPKTLANCQKLDEFNIENNDIATLPEGLLSSMKRLTSIVLSRNQFVHFPPGGPSQFTNCLSVAMDHNEIGSIPVGMFSTARHLTKLDLNTNNIQLDLGNNRLTCIPDEIELLQRLETLVLSHNSINKLTEKIGACIGHLSELREINLISNKLATIPLGITLLPLVVLRLSENCIREVPREIGHMTNLKELYLNDNRDLENLPSTLSLLDYHHQIEELQRRLRDQRQCLSRLESDLASERDSRRSDSERQTEDLARLRDRYDRLLESHKRLSRVNAGLEEKLLDLAGKFDAEQRTLLDKLASSETKLAEAEQTVERLKIDRERCKTECEIAVRMLRARPDAYLTDEDAAAGGTLLDDELPASQAQVRLMDTVY
uniref:Protein lap1 n=1 Tax=Macrostomum lignano TaxID=282301 RepID=A0A1I8H3A7_9PLAT